MAEEGDGRTEEKLSRGVSGGIYRAQEADGMVQIG